MYHAKDVDVLRQGSNLCFASFDSVGNLSDLTLMTIKLTQCSLLANRRNARREIKMRLPAVVLASKVLLSNVKIYMKFADG